MLLAVSACTSRTVVTNDLPACERCHGGSGSAAPPRSAHGAVDTTDRGVGAHRSHLEGSQLRAPLTCDTCHDVPTSVDAHVDGVARVRFKDPVAAGGAAARWNPGTGRCDNVYCHGATLRPASHGTASAPEWTRVDGSQMECGSCHGFPPVAPHPAVATGTAGAGACHRCHGETVQTDGTIAVAGGKHMDGTVQGPDASRCDGCHDAPPASGAHLAHANWPDPTALSYGSLAIEVGTSPGGAPAYLFGCGYCHPVAAAEHQNGAVNVDVAPAGSGLKLLNAANAAFDPASESCSGVYCHGSTLRAGSQGSATSPVWTAPSGTQNTCASCHARPPASHAAYQSPTRCQSCHSATVNPDGTINVAGRQHINGSTPVPTACNGCHAAPPDSGAHLAHANWPDPTALSYGTLAIEVGTSPAGAPAYLFGCGYCHPTQAARHQDGTADVDVAPAGSGLKLLNAANAAFDPAGSSCSGVYCHGSTLRAGSQGNATSPVWTAPGGTQNTCASCHARPPASHAAYQTPTECQRCHSATVNADGSIDVAGRQHINGSTPVPTACNACHAAPPASGAHLAHANVTDVASLSYGSLAVTVGTSPAGAPAYVFGCGHCHPLDAASHQDGAREIALAPAGGGLKLLNAASAAFDAGAASCSGVYCHGATLRAGTQGSTPAPVWTVVDGSQKTCASCHAAPPGSHAGFPAPTACGPCHPQTVNASGGIDVAGLAHVNGSIQVATACNACHAAPPDTGAHRAHANPPDPSATAYGGLTVLENVSPGGGPSYDFGCGHCHPLDEALHFRDAGADGLPDVVLAAPAPHVPGDLVKSRNLADASFDPAAGTCSGVYCHSSGQDPRATVVYRTTPAWTAAPGTLGCASCHDNPPKYPSGGPGAPDANSHVDLALMFGSASFPDWEFGHFAGLPGADHNSKHGGGYPGWPAGSKASPITCQACHSETVDPTKVRGTSGFFYFDPDGDYDLRDDRPGVGDPSRGSAPEWIASQCVTCHAAELGSGGRVRPLRHVNGKREVTFDRRTALPADYPTGLPTLDTAEPVRPFYMITRGGMDVTLTSPTVDCAATPDVPSCGVAADVAFRGTLVPDPNDPTQLVAGDPVLTLTLEHATYDPATKTCSSVACHLERQRLVEGPQEPSYPVPPLRWGEPYNYYGCSTPPCVVTCSTCHQQ